MNNDNAINNQKHGISFESAQEAFSDPFHLSIIDHRFYYFKECWISIGQTHGIQVVVVVHLYFDESGDEHIRIISTRADEYDFSSGIRGRFFQPHKMAATIRLDNDIVMYFKKISSETKQGYQTLMNNALRTYVSTHEGGIRSR